ncbi:MAG TPA: ABC-F family ATP-binding cassette domain-containing protein, partial [Micropepsaceae bacterium]|nr:ABC-F family ATP-binding cassette domain-containing protein [Micropepsaceae bacterium]
MAPPLLHLRDIALTFGGAPLLEAAELKVEPGGRVALVGRNGSGKSTLLKIAAGLVLPDKGTRFLQPGARVRYLPQEPDLSAFATVLAYVEDGLDEGDDTHQARRILGELGLDPDAPPQRLSGGEVRRAGLARTLAPSPDVLLLDEPTNHLDLPAIEWLEGELKASPAALVLISHDRRFLTAMSRQCVWLDRGATRTLDRGFDAFEEWRDQLMEEEERERHKLDRQIVREQDWLRYGVTARRKRNVRRLAQLHDLRARAKSWRGPQGDAKIAAVEGGTSGTLVIEAKDISISFGGREIVSRFSTRIHRGDRVGVIGANGAGKTTLLKMLTGNLAPDSGQVRLGSAVEMVTLDQMRSSLDARETLSGTLTGGRGDQVIVGGQSRHVMSYMKDFLF